MLKRLPFISQYKTNVNMKKPKKKVFITGGLSGIVYASALA